MLAGDVITSGTQTYDTPVVISAARTLASTFAGEDGISFTNSVSLGTTVAGPATLTLEGNTAFSASSHIGYRLPLPSSETSSLIEVKGDLRISAALTLQGFGGFAPGEYRLIDYTGSLTATGLAVATLPFGYAASISSAARAR